MRVYLRDKASGINTYYDSLDKALKDLKISKKKLHTRYEILRRFPIDYWKDVPKEEWVTKKKIKEVCLITDDM